MDRKVINIKKALIDKDKIYKKNFKKCIGSGRMDLALREDYMDNLRIVQEEIGFAQIRGHGIFGDQTGCYREYVQAGAMGKSKLDKPIYSFKNIIRIYEKLLSVGVKPFVEFGFMPSQMSISNETVFWWQGNVCEPKEEKLWTNLIESFLVSIIDYFGIDEVKKWNFEVWNEPCANFWRPTSGEKEVEYYKLYENTAKTVKSINKDLKIGGPATQGQGTDWIVRFLNYCNDNNVPVDFVSHHIYSGKNRKFVGEFCYMDMMEPETTLDLYKYIVSLKDKAPQRDLPLHITEWNTSFSCIELIHDMPLNAAYVAYLLTHVDDIVDSYSYWVFCDVFEESDIPRALFHGGFGLLTENGIRKPTFYAFKFANKLKKYILHLDNQSIVTKDESGKIAILLFNPKVDIEYAEPENIEIKIKTSYREVVVSTQMVDNENGNAYETWVKLGRHRWPNKEQMEIIKRAQYPKCEIYRLKSDNGLLNLFMQLPVNGIQLVEIDEFKDCSNEYQGLKK